MNLTEREAEQLLLGFGYEGKSSGSVADLERALAEAKEVITAVQRQIKVYRGLIDKKAPASQRLSRYAAAANYVALIRPQLHLKLNTVLAETDELRAHHLICTRLI